MKSYLIQPEQRTITAVDYDGDYRSIYRLCGWQTFSIIQLDEGNALAIDDEGLMNGPLHFFAFGTHPTPVCGNALVIGPEGKDGTQLDCSYTIDQIREAVIFLTQEEAVEIHNDAIRDQRSDMAIMKARGYNVIDATVGLSLDDDGKAGMS